MDCCDVVVNVFELRLVTPSHSRDLTIIDAEAKRCVCVAGT